MAEHRDWSIFARKRLHTLDDVSLVAGIRSAHCTIFRRAGIKKLSKLSKYQMDNPSVKGIPKVTFEILKDQANIQLASIGKEKPEFKVSFSYRGKKRFGDASTSSIRPIFFSIWKVIPLLGSEWAGIFIRQCYQ